MKAHGLSGKASNREKFEEQKNFKEFVCAHCSSTGRNADKHGRLRGATFYLDSAWVVLRQFRAAGDLRPSSSGVINSALTAAGLSTVQDDVPLRWLRTFFGSTSSMAAVAAPSDERTTLYPRMTDVCCKCLMLLADLRSEHKVPKKPKQQSDQHSLLRREAIEKVPKSIGRG